MPKLCYIKEQLTTTAQFIYGKQHTGTVFFYFKNKNKQPKSNLI